MTLARLVQKENEFIPMVLTESGMAMLVRLPSLANAPVPMAVTSLPLIVFGMITTPSAPL